MIFSFFLRKQHLWLSLSARTTWNTLVRSSVHSPARLQDQTRPKWSHQVEFLVPPFCGPFSSHKMYNTSAEMYYFQMKWTIFDGHCLWCLWQILSMVKKATNIWSSTFSTSGSDLEPIWPCLQGAQPRNVHKVGNFSNSSSSLEATQCSPFSTCFLPERMTFAWVWSNIKRN